MTTIATDGKSMAGDGLLTGNGIVHGFDFRKVFRLADGRIAGFCGDSYALPAVVEWLNNGGNLPDIDPENFEGLILHPDGRCQSVNGKGQMIDQPVPAVTGSGGAIALGAMLAGASPTEAVDIACQRDCKTGGQIITKWIA